MACYTHNIRSIRLVKIILHNPHVWLYEYHKTVAAHEIRNIKSWLHLKLNYFKTISTFVNVPTERILPKVIAQLISEAYCSSWIAPIMRLIIRMWLLNRLVHLCTLAQQCWRRQLTPAVQRPVLVKASHGPSRTSSSGSSAGGTRTRAELAHPHSEPLCTKTMTAGRRPGGHAASSGSAGCATPQRHCSFALKNGRQTSTWVATAGCKPTWPPRIYR